MNHLAISFAEQMKFKVALRRHDIAPFIWDSDLALIPLLPLPPTKVSFSLIPRYEFMWAKTSSYDHGEHVVWNKNPYLKEAFVHFPNVKLLYWLDIDIIIMILSIILHDHILTKADRNKNGAFGKELGRVGGGSLGYTTPVTVDENQINLIISSDRWGMNAGTSLMRGSNWTDWLLDMWDDPP